MAKTMNDDDYRKKYEGKLTSGKWISGLGDHADHDGQSLITRNHEASNAGPRSATARRRP